MKRDDVTVYHQGTIPETFRGLEEATIAFAHVDVDIRQSVTDCCEFIFPRLAVDAYFAGREVVPLVLPTGQAVVFRGEKKTSNIEH